jgi:hypothetical protein
MKSLLLAASVLIATAPIAVAQAGPGSGTGAGAGSGYYGTGAGMGGQPADRGAVNPPAKAGDAPLDSGRGDPEKPSAERNRPQPKDTDSGSVQPGSVGSMGSGSNP